MSKNSLKNKIKFYLIRIYRLTFASKKHKEVVWKDLKIMFSSLGCKHGIYEREKYIETSFLIGEDVIADYYYLIYEDYFHCRVDVLKDYPEDLVTELFILSTHLNNILNIGVVVVDVKENAVLYYEKKPLLVPFLYNGNLHAQLSGHYKTSKDIYAAFHRLVQENEAPAIIIADLLSKWNYDYDNGN
jgi:hypothetical protein